VRVHDDDGSAGGVVPPNGLGQGLLGAILDVPVDRQGEVVKVKERLGDDRVIVVGRGDEEMVATLGADLQAEGVRAGDLLMYDQRSGVALEHLPKEEVEERAIPFSPGDEVLVAIVEPHMYNVDDAVAKIDSYIVSVTGGFPYVGQKHLVRIEEVGRTAATATLLDADPATTESDGDGTVDSTTRRRGRRGGRRRSRAKTETSET